MRRVGNAADLFGSRPSTLDSRPFRDTLPIVKPFLVLLGLFLCPLKVPGASGMFPKMPAATNVYAIDCHKDNQDAKMTSWALQGLVNQVSAEVYSAHQGHYREQLKNCGKPFKMLDPLDGTNGGLRSLFQKYQGQV